MDLLPGMILRVPYEGEDGAEECGYMKLISPTRGMWYASKEYLESLEFQPAGIEELRNGELVLCGCWPDEGLCDDIPTDLSACEVVSEEQLRPAGFTINYGNELWEVIRYTLPSRSTEQDAQIAVDSCLSFSGAPFADAIAQGTAELVIIEPRAGLCQMCKIERNSCGHIFYTQSENTAYLLGPTCAQRASFAIAAAATVRRN